MDILQGRKTSNEITLSDLLNSHKRDVQLSTNCHAIGTIEAFNSADQTCTVKIAYSMQVYESAPNSPNGVAIVEKQYPLLIDCPTVIITGGSAGLTMPIAVGDSCLVLFNDRDIENWFNGATSGPVASTRLHSITDAIALVGIRSLAQSIADYDSVNPTLYNGTTRIKVKSSKILLENSTDKLGLLLKELIDTIKSITTSNAVVGVPCTISPASQAQLALVSTKIEGLLE
jgi:hypothetical protein